MTPERITRLFFLGLFGLGTAVTAHGLWFALLA